MDERKQRKFISYPVKGKWGVPLTLPNGACLKALGRTNRKEKVSQRVMICWLRLLETNETNPLGEVLGMARKAGGKQLDEQN
jgi:hypothetical protein